MATLRNKRKLAAVTRETQKERSRNGQSRNTSVPRNKEEYITQVSEEIEDRNIKKLTQEFSRTESRISGALSKLDEFLLNPQIRTHSGTVPGTFGTQTWKTRNQMKIVPWMILILKWDPPSVSPVIQLIQTQTRLLTTNMSAHTYGVCVHFSALVEKFRIFLIFRKRGSQRFSGLSELPFEPFEVSAAVCYAFFSKKIQKMASNRSIPHYSKDLPVYCKVSCNLGFQQIPFSSGRVGKPFEVS